MEKKFEYRGSLATTPLPEILATIERYRVPGALRVSSGERHRRIFLDSGLVVFAASDEPEVRLGNYLIRQGKLPEEAVRSAEARLSGDSARLGQILLRLELLDQTSLDAAIGEQVREILWGAFDWENGEVVFEVGSRRSEETIRIDLPIADVIVEGIRRSAAVKRFIDRLGAGHSVLERTNGGAREGLLKESESAYLEAVDGRTPLQLLCQKGPGTVSENARLLYAFFCLDLVRIKEAPGVRKLQWKTEGGAIGES
jgi:two-component system, OmpR family, response regulator